MNRLGSSPNGWPEMQDPIMARLCWYVRYITVPRKQWELKLWRGRRHSAMRWTQDSIKDTSHERSIHYETGDVTRQSLRNGRNLGILYCNTISANKTKGLMHGHMVNKKSESDWYCRTRWKATHNNGKRDRSFIVMSWLQRQTCHGHHQGERSIRSTGRQLQAESTK